MRPQVFLGQRQGGLRPARGAHRADRPFARAARGGGRRRMRTGNWQPRAAGGKRETPQARLQEQAHHRARALCGGPRPSPASPSRSSCRTARELADPNVVVEDVFIVGARRFVRLRRKQSGPAGDFQRRPRDGLRPADAARGGRRPQDRTARPTTASPPPIQLSIRRCCRGACWRTRRSSSISKPARASSASASSSAGALVQRRLPPLAIRLSVPRRHAARAGEPPSRGDAGVARLLGRRGRPPACSWKCRRARASAATRAAAVRPAQRSDLPRRRRGAHAAARPTRCRSTSTAAPRSRCRA